MPWQCTFIKEASSKWWTEGNTHTLSQTVRQYICSGVRTKQQGKTEGEKGHACIAEVDHVQDVLRRLLTRPPTAHTTPTNQPLATGRAALPKIVGVLLLHYFCTSVLVGRPALECQVGRPALECRLGGPALECRVGHPALTCHISTTS